MNKKNIIAVCIGSLLSINAYAQPGFLTGYAAYWVTKGVCYKKLSDTAVRTASTPTGAVAVVGTAYVGSAATMAAVETTATSVGATVAALTPFLP